MRHFVLMIMQKLSSSKISDNFNNQSIFNRLFRGNLSFIKQENLNFYFIRGVAFYHLGEYKKAMANFSKALRLDWRNERVVLWIDRADRAHRTTLHSQAAQEKRTQDEVSEFLSVWDRPTSHRFSFARI
ncbi:MAG TPA: tetratricopeptide repeat protein [Microvirga sp.]|nr:tetratricopeptide repeat protein [Microvirga sp.]